MNATTHLSTRSSLVVALLLVCLSGLARTASGSVTQNWVADYQGTGDSFPQSMAVDSAGNVVVTGYSFGSDQRIDCITVKYDGVSGAQLWAARYTGPETNDVGWSVVVDSMDDVVISGSSIRSTDSRYFTVKYDGATGAELWTTPYDPSGFGYDFVGSVALDDAGNPIVTGTSQRGATAADALTVKYDGNTGAELWVARLVGPGQARDFGTAVVVDGAGNVIVSGQTGLGTAADYLTVKYDGDSGAQLWIARYDGPGNQEDITRSIAVDGAGHVFVTGRSVGTDSGGDYATVKYDGTTGARLWVARYDGPGRGDDSAESLVLDPAGNVVVTGFAIGTGTKTDYATVKYNGTTGARLWAARYNGPVNAEDEASSVALDSAGNVIVTGYSTQSDTNTDYATVKYNGATGARLWAARFDGPDNSYDFARSVRVDKADSVLVTGFSVRGGKIADYATVKYTASAIAIDITAACRIAWGPQRKDRRTGRWVQQVIVTYVSASPAPGPISLALDSLPEGVTLFNKSGDTQCALPGGSPYRDSPRSFHRRGAAISFALEFTNPASRAITYTPRVLAGAGMR